MEAALHCGMARQEQPTWRSLAARFWPQYLAVGVMAVLLNVVDTWEPKERSIYFRSDAEYWRYSYATKPETVPHWAVPVLALGLPLLVFVVAHLAGWVSRAEMHHACLNVLACVTTTGFLSSFLKSQVARPRPDFMARCFPSGGHPIFSPAGVPQCEAGVAHDVLKTGMRSFPSVHAAWSASGTGFLSLWLMGRLRAFATGARPGALLLSLSPLLPAIYIGVTRLQNHRHHPEDVLIAFVMGMVLARLFYLQAFAGPFSPHAGCLKPVAEARAKAEEGGLRWAMHGASSSLQHLLSSEAVAQAAEPAGVGVV